MSKEVYTYSSRHSSHSYVVVVETLTMYVYPKYSIDGIETLKYNTLYQLIVAMQDIANIRDWELES